MRASQFARIEWLADIVVRTEFEADDAIDVFLQRRQQDDRSSGVRRAARDRGPDLEAPFSSTSSTTRSYACLASAWFIFRSAFRPS